MINCCEPLIRLDFFFERNRLWAGEVTLSSGCFNSSITDEAARWAIGISDII